MSNIHQVKMVAFELFGDLYDKDDELPIDEDGNVLYDENGDLLYDKDAYNAFVDFLIDTAYQNADAFADYVVDHCPHLRLIDREAEQVDRGDDTQLAVECALCFELDYENYDEYFELYLKDFFFPFDAPLVDIYEKTIYAGDLSRMCRITAGSYDCKMVYSLCDYMDYNNCYKGQEIPRFELCY